MLVQEIINGISVGSVYALLAVGYALIYSLLGFTNFAHAITVSIGAYTAFFTLMYAIPNLYVGIFAGMIAGGLMALFIERVIYHSLLKKGIKRIYLMIAGLGVMVMSENLVIISFTGRFRIYPVNFSDKAVNILGASVSTVDIVIFFISIAALLLLQVFIQKSRVGLAIRGASFDLDTTSLMGVSTMKLIGVVFILAGVLAGLAGTMLGAKYTTYPTLAGNMTNKAFVCSVIGGLGSIPGAVLGALVLGVCETMIAGYVSSSLRDLFTYTVLVLVLLIKPSGLLGKNSEDKA